MNAKTEIQPMQWFNTFKWLVIFVLLAAGIVANSYFTNQPVAIRLVGWVILLAITVGIAFFTTQGQQTWSFLQDARMEMRKVVWPTRQETIQTTLVVIAMVTVMALFLWGVDTLLLWLVGLLTGQRG